ncbi:zinc ribbon domain-containing protein [Variovorax sp. J22P240]|uniref:zinc ribbon domain-containing protein n=1 Tax=Variovorax sp. J22P240 TaxID=3053514 RepID=UPI00257509F9|nr:zinc ribbon domain-containing protein [Variovorax sp. J22P240]MDM0002985.1 zinc ribbon domain-containing protein [Variovorax sp. J22P240]
MTDPTTENDAGILNTTLQHRADYIPLEDLAEETAHAGALFHRVTTELTNRALRTIVGPRGCGKTHMMRYAWLTCRDSKLKPFAIFASFQRYFRLEPLLSSSAGASQLFHSWVLARVLLSAKESCDAWNPKLELVTALLESQGYPFQSLLTLATKLERNQVIDGEWAAFSDSLSIERTKIIIDQLREAAGRKFTVLLLDDAAMTLTPDYLVEFLDIVRSLKSATISPKVSVYPGTTEMSPRFHEGQDAVSIPAWISIEDSQYESIMFDIASVRVRGLERISDDAQALLRFAAFGIPRAYLTMLEDYLRGGFRTSQQGVTRIINDHLQARLGEFRTLGKKIPKLEILVARGEKLVHEIGIELKGYNRTLLPRHEKGVTYGLRVEEKVALLDRTLKLLVEAGLIFNDGEVKHGSPTRIYHKYIPHSALLLNLGAFTGEEGSGSIRHNLEAIRYKSTKHPLRKSLASIVGDDFVASLNLALPRCAHCHEQRLSDNQRFCHNCGQQLVDASAFNQCLDTPITEVPGLTAWQRSQIAENLPFFRTIRDYLAKQDPAAELLTVSGFGKRRTARIVDVLNSYVDDFLS